MTQPTTPQAVVDSPVLTDTPDEAEPLHCPLCDYDLRNLPENRCPECGHAFDPAELLRARAEHRQVLWSFEHAPRRRLPLAFLQTALLSLRPARFWRRLGAAFPLRRGRLAVWTIAWLLLTLLPFLAGYGWLTYRWMMIVWLPPGSVSGPPGSGLPSPTTSLAEAIRMALGDRRLRSLVTVAVALLAWMPLTLLGIAVFAQTLRAAGIRWGHLWRIVAYAMPCLFLPVIVGAIGAVAYRIDQPALVLLGGLGLGVLHSLFAHTRYLRVRHALAQAVLVQVMVLLSLLLLALISGDLR